MGTDTGIVSQALVNPAEKNFLGIILKHNLLIMVILRLICFQTNEAESWLVKKESMIFGIKTFLDNLQGTERSDGKIGWIIVSFLVLSKKDLSKIWHESISTWLHYLNLPEYTNCLKATNILTAFHLFVQFLKTLLE